MIEHLFLPGVNFLKLPLLPPYKEWLIEWLEKSEEDIENGLVSSSMCLQGVFSELLLYGNCQTDWIGIIQTYLKSESGIPLAYSKEFGNLLYKFDAQWEQSPIHAIYTHWWIEKINGVSQENLEVYNDLIQEMIQINGWIYNSKVSKTNVKTRMKSELMMSMAMGIDILNCNSSLSKRKNLFEALISSVSMTGFLSAEYFRLIALKYLNSIELAPYNFADVLAPCEAGDGYCDFSINSKVDDYMGTAKRVSRDKALHSAISSLQALYTASLCEDDVKYFVQSRIRNFGKHLLLEPFDIPAFRMRDIDVPFGTDLSPLEIIAASQIISIEKN